MAAIAHASSEQATAQTTTSAVYVDVSGASIASGSFTTGKKYLVLATAQIFNQSANTFNYVRLVHGSTAFAESEFIHARTQPFGGIFQFLTVWTAVASEGLKVQFKTDGGTAEIDNIAIVAINLSDDLTENTDWYFAERATDDSLSSTFLDGASLTFSPGTAGHDWLVISYAQIDPGDTVNSMISRLDRSGEAASTAPEARYIVTNAAGPLGQFLLSRVFNLGAASNTFKERAATSSGTAHTRLHSSVFALNLNKFKEHSNAYTDADTALALGAGYDTQLQTMSITPSVASDVLVGAYWGADVDAAGRTVNTRVQVDNADQPAGQTAGGIEFSVGFGDSDEFPMSFVTIPNLTAAAHTVDLDASLETGGAGNGQHRALWAFTMELAVAAVKSRELLGRGIGRGLGRGIR